MFRRGVNRFADRRIWPFWGRRLRSFSDKLSGFADLKNTVDRGSAENFGPDSGLCISRSSDCGSNHSFSVSLGQFCGVLSTNFFSFNFFCWDEIFSSHIRWTITLDLQIDRGLDKLNATYIFTPSYLMLGFTATQTISK